jgi:hypothetical protein
MTTGINRDPYPRRKTVRRKSDRDEIDLQLREIGDELIIHITDEQKRNKIVDELYKLLVTGNGIPSFQERVRILESWVKTMTYFISAIVLMIVSYLLTRFWVILFP